MSQDNELLKHPVSIILDREPINGHIFGELRVAMNLTVGDYSRSSLCSL